MSVVVAVVVVVVRWCVGALVRWCVGALVRWCVGALVRWCVGNGGGSVVVFSWWWCVGGVEGVFWMTEVNGLTRTPKSAPLVVVVLLCHI